MVKRYMPQFKDSGKKKYSNFRNSYGNKKLAKKFIVKTRKKFKAVKRTGRFRIKTITIKI